MGIFSKLFGKKDKPTQVRQRKKKPDVFDIQREDEKMNWAMEKSRLTLHHFEKCLLAPSPAQQYFSIKVKIEDGGKVEHIWLNSPSFDDDNKLFGVVGNEPIDVRNVAFNQKIGIDRKKVSDWMIIEDGRLIGGYTIRAIRDNLTGDAVANFDKSVGGMHIDYGEDYFLPSDETPEGAIVKIEQAYDEDNLEKALLCKDFEKEAELMLAKMNPELSSPETIHSTAELLKLSFMKSLQESGMPKFHGIKRAFPKREKMDDNHMIITEVCYYPDGGHSLQRLHTWRNNTGWKVLHPEE